MLILHTKILCILSKTLEVVCHYGHMLKTSIMKPTTLLLLYNTNSVLYTGV